jgi:hypothetical protein
MCAMRRVLAGIEAAALLVLRPERPGETRPHRLLLETHLVPTVPRMMEP